MSYTPPTRFELKAVDPEQLRTFLKTWYHPEDLVLLVARPTGSDDPRIGHESRTAEEWSRISREELADIQRAFGGRYALQVQVNPTTTRRAGIGKRGREDTVREIYGVVLDLDVKSGSFISQDHAVSFLKSFPEDLRPTLIVRNGEGGVHGWFRCDGLSKDDLKAFWAYAQEQAGDIQIDRLVDATRIMRLPGSVWYQKDGTKYGPVRIVGGTGKSVAVEALRRHTKPADQRHKVRNQSVRRDSTKVMDGAMGIACNVFWSRKDWGEILLPADWTFHRFDDSEGRREWTRPGGSGKSATTGFDGNPDTDLSLLSSSADTGLADLKAAGVPLSKARVAMRLLAGDDPEVMSGIIRPL